MGISENVYEIIYSLKKQSIALSSPAVSMYNLSGFERKQQKRYIYNGFSFKKFPFVNISESRPLHKLSLSHADWVS